MERLFFIKQYFSMPRFVGALLPSSKYLAVKMVGKIDFDNARCIVEYGPGTGVFTEELIKNRKPNTIILLIEYNQQFYNLLKKKYYGELNMHIINDSAENVDKYLMEYNFSCADYIISGLPFASLPHNVSAVILEKTRKYLKKDGKFITFQYTLFKKSLIQGYFSRINIKKEIRNVPPAYIFSCNQ